MKIYQYSSHMFRLFFGFCQLNDAHTANISIPALADFMNCNRADCHTLLSEKRCVFCHWTEVFVHEFIFECFQTIPAQTEYTHRSWIPSVLGRYGFFFLILFEICVCAFFMWETAHVRYNFSPKTRTYPALSCFVATGGWGLTMCVVCVLKKFWSFYQFWMCVLFVIFYRNRFENGLSITSNSSLSFLLFLFALLVLIYCYYSSFNSFRVHIASHIHRMHIIRCVCATFGVPCYNHNENHFSSFLISGSFLSM